MMNAKGMRVMKNQVVRLRRRSEDMLALMWGVLYQADEWVRGVRRGREGGFDRLK